MSSTRHGEARSALREVQSRHQDIQKIERTITELAQLFNEMSIMIEIQETAIDNIEQKAQETETQMESGLQATEQAVVKARSARRKKWYCIGMIVLIISTSLSLFRNCPCSRTWRRCVDCVNNANGSCDCCDCDCGETCDKVGCRSFAGEYLMSSDGISWFHSVVVRRFGSFQWTLAQVIIKQLFYTDLNSTT